MNDETRDIGFRGDIKIPREIQSIKAEIFGGMNLRELCYVAIGIVLAGIVAYLMFGVLHWTGSFAVMMPALAFAPFFALAKMKKSGMDLEDWLLICYSNNFKSRSVRVNEVENDFQKLEHIYQSKFEKKEKNKESKKEFRARKKASPYKAFV